MTEIEHNHPHTPDAADCPDTCPVGGAALWRARRRVPVAATGAPPLTSEPPTGRGARVEPLYTEDDRRSVMAEQLERWWSDKTQAEIEGVVPKAIEYSSTDLVDLGRQLADLAGWAGLTDARATELGIWFYIAGKVARAMGAIKEKRLPSDDTVHDIAIYTKMIQRTRDAGSWPGV